MNGPIPVVVSAPEETSFLPLLRVLSRRTAVTIGRSDRPVAGAVNVGGVEFARADPSCSAYLSSRTLGPRWDLIYVMDRGGWVVSGEDPGRAGGALLTVVDALLDRDGAGVASAIRHPVFDSYQQSFDDCSFGFSRGADDFQIDLHMLEMLRSGIESFEINRLHDDVPVQVRERSVRHDPYPWWNSYMPALDMFYDSSLTRGTYPPDMLRRNRATMLETARLARGLGLELVYTAFEPRAWPERLFHRYPELRGARVDHPAYSCEPEYAPDTNHPLVLGHYRELMRQLVKDVPDLSLFEVWAQDSAAGFPWARRLYPGANGPMGVRARPVWESVNRLLLALRDEASRVNSGTRVHINISWVFHDEEKAEIVRHLPDELGVSFGFGRTAAESAPHHDEWDLLRRHGKTGARALREGIGCNWKRYGPLMGFPFPRRTWARLTALLEAGVRNVAFRGGIVSSVYVPLCINNEVIKAFKHAGTELDLDALLAERAAAWTSDRQEAAALEAAWQLCDEFDELYSRCGMHWTTSMFVSPRTLFRKLVRPIVPDHTLLSHMETRYYLPNVFLAHDTDPSWHDISWFNFEQVSSDAAMGDAVDLLDRELLPRLEACLGILDRAGEGCSEVVRDTRDRVRCYYRISCTERDLLDTQVAIHRHATTDDESETAALRGRIRSNMLRDMETTERFIALLKQTRSVLIPVTSGEETPYLFKAPLSHLLERKIIAMRSHLDDLPGPSFAGNYYLGHQEGS